MESVIQTLTECLEFEDLSQELCNESHITAVKSRYPQCSARMILATFMICKFPEIVFANSELVESAKHIQVLLAKDQDIKSTDEYFAIFLAWKTDDAEKLQLEISSGISMLEDLHVEEFDEADAQWNHGISENVRRMEECKEILASFSPPSDSSTGP
mgnify:CR=1 FL=1